MGDEAVNANSRHILIRSLVDLIRLMPFEGWTLEDAFVCWAIRLAALEGQQADMVWIMARTGFSRGTVQRRLKANVLAGTVAVSEDGRRKVYVHTAKADAMTADYYAALDAILSRYGEEAV